MCQIGTAWVRLHDSELTGKALDSCRQDAHHRLRLRLCRHFQTDTHLQRALQVRVSVCAGAFTLHRFVRQNVTPAMARLLDGFLVRLLRFVPLSFPRNPHQPPTPTPASRRHASPSPARGASRLTQPNLAA